MTQPRAHLNQPTPRRATSTPRHDTSQHHHPRHKLATPRRGTPRLGMEPDLQHALPTPRPHLGVCTTPNPTRIPRNHPPPITYTLTHSPQPYTLYLNPPKLTSNTLQTQPQQLQLPQTHSNPTTHTQTLPCSTSITTHTLQPRPQPSAPLSHA
ncbi:hypothetical protein PIB30_072410 [Stylosanthes scabra]|uniref:Uncharacterized protein n=1 Tax=Stylosanthes scabra TaxID=79078 RepID=A0ABU6SQ01_9FABA|nr:hypothetical protein [Stylosanthes scabra]